MFPFKYNYITLQFSWNIRYIELNTLLFSLIIKNLNRYSYDIHDMIKIYVLISSRKPHEICVELPTRLVVNTEYINPLSHYRKFLLSRINLIQCTVSQFHNLYKLLCYNQIVCSKVVDKI